MGKYTERIKTAIRRRVAQGLSLEESYHRVQTAHWKAEQVWQKEIDEIKQEAKSKKRDQTDAENKKIDKKVAAKGIERMHRKEAEDLQAAGWKPANEQ